MAELDIAGTAPLMANFADGGKTIIVTGAPATAARRWPNKLRRRRRPLRQTRLPPQPQPQQPSAPALSGAHRSRARRRRHRSGHHAALPEKDVVLALARRVQRELAVAALRPGCCAIQTSPSLWTSAPSSANAARPALVYRAARRQHRPRRACVHRDAAGSQRSRAQGFLPWDTAQAAFLDLSGSVAGSVAAELEARKLPNATLLAPLRPMNNIAAPAIAVEIAPPGDKVEDIASAEYQEQVAQSIAAGIAAVRCKLPEVRP